MIINLISNQTQRKFSIDVNISDFNLNNKIPINFPDWNLCRNDYFLQGGICYVDDVDFDKIKYFFNVIPTEFSMGSIIKNKTCTKKYIDNL